LWAAMYQNHRGNDQYKRHPTSSQLHLALASGRSICPAENPSLLTAGNIQFAGRQQFV
jgi:hypothetical protein